MKTILGLISIASLFLTTGCIVRERGGGYDGTEYRYGEYHRYPHRDWDNDHGYYDHDRWHDRDWRY